MEFYSIRNAEPRLLLRKDHPLASLPMVSLQDLSPYPLVSYDYGVDGSVYVSEEGVTMLQTDRKVAVSDGLMLVNVLVSTDACAVATPYLSTLMENCGIVFRPIIGVKPLHLGWIKRRTGSSSPWQNSISKCFGPPELESSDLSAYP